MSRNCFAASIGCKKEGHVPHYVTTSATAKIRTGEYGKPNVAIFNSFNFISSFVFCIQLCVQYSTCIQHSTRYSIFNFPFNIQLFILYSILHSPIQLSIQQFQLFIQHSTLIFKTFNYSFNIQLFIQHSTIHSTLLSPHYFWSVTQIIAC